MQFDSRLFAALAKKIVEAQDTTSHQVVAQLLDSQNYARQVGYWHGLNAVASWMDEIAKQEESGEQLT